VLSQEVVVARTTEMDIVGLERGWIHSIRWEMAIIHTGR
jgi:hypothetical protein